MSVEGLKKVIEELKSLKSSEGDSAYEEVLKKESELLNKANEK